MDDPSADLLARVAACRARGASWEMAGEKLDRDPADLERQAAADRKGYRRWLALAQNDVLDELFAEGVMVLRQELRRPGDKAKAKAAGDLVRLWANVYRHRVKPKGKGEKVVDRAAGLTDEQVRFAKAVASLSPERRRDLDELGVARFLRENPGWKPPDDDPPGPASFGDDGGPPPDGPGGGRPPSGPLPRCGGEGA